MLHLLLICSFHTFLFTSIYKARHSLTSFIIRHLIFIVKSMYLLFIYVWTFFYTKIISNFTTVQLYSTVHGTYCTRVRTVLSTVCTVLQVRTVGTYLTILFRLTLSFGYTLNLFIPTQTKHNLTASCHKQGVPRCPT